MPLGELLAVRAVEERQVGVARDLLAERLQDEDLLRGVGEVVVAADHVGDPHVGVVDGDREVVEDGTVRAGDHGVVLESVLEADLAADRVGDDGLPLVRDAQADRGVRGVGGLSPVALIGARLAEGLDVSARCGVAVGVARLEQLRQPFGVALGPLVLADRALVPVELEPAQRVEDLGDVLVGGPLAVGVLDPQDELPARAPGREPVVERRPRAADVQRACRRGGESNSNGGSQGADRGGCFHSGPARPDFGLDPLAQRDRPR